MTRTTSRRLTLADLAILIAGSAFALSLWRFSSDTLRLGAGYYLSLTMAYKISVWPAPAVLSLAGSLLIARIIPPRPRRKVMFRQPGIWAALAILASQLILVLFMSWQEKLRPFVSGARYHPNLNNYLFANRFAGAWVAVAWATLALSGAGRPEPTWIDRTGRVLGGLVILQWIASMTMS